jgi:hypothetical protein
VQNATLWRALLGVEKTVVDHVEFDEDEQVLVAHVRPRVRARARARCGRCRRRSPAYDRGEGRRRWRALDLGTIQVELEADAPRVSCAEHGPTVAAVPWARHAAGHTYVFDEQVAWLATVCSKSAVTELMRVAWRTVGAIITRVWADVEAVHDLFAGLTRIGIDEISYKRGHRYLTVVVDHESGRLVWAPNGRVGVRRIVPARRRTRPSKAVTSRAQDAGSRKRVVGEPARAGLFAGTAHTRSWRRPRKALAASRDANSRSRVTKRSSSAGRQMWCARTPECSRIWENRSKAACQVVKSVTGCSMRRVVMQISVPAGPARNHPRRLGSSRW